MNLRLAPALLIFGVFMVTPGSTYAQQNPTDEESGVETGFGAAVSCVEWTELSLDPECIHQRGTESKGIQQQARWYNRYWQMALMAASQIYVTVQWAKDTYDLWRDTFDMLTAAVTGFDLERPHRTAYVLRRVNTRFERRLDQQEEMMKQHQITEVDDRFEIINAAVMDALHVANLVDQSATSLSEKGLAMQMRLNGDETRVVLLEGDQATGAPSVGDLPPVADGEDDVRGFYDSIQNSQPQTVSGIRLTSSAGPRMASGDGANLTDEELACPLDEVTDQDPVVIFARAANMAMGAQTGARGLSAEAAAKLETLGALDDLEAAREREMKWREAFRSMLSF